jgi:drug/metabolite transporter (DMT)-like permease
MILEILSKILSESLLSLYPIFIKYINISFGLQIWSRFFTFIMISIFFIDWKFIYENVFSKSGLLLAFMTSLHVYCSHRGFIILESGIAYIIFYTYPIFILLLSKEKINFLIIFAIIGVYLLSQENIDHFDIFKKKNNTEYFKYEGVLMILLASITEAFIYFIVRDIKTENNWNHLFISYIIVSILLSIYYFNDIKKIKIESPLSMSIIINLIIGVFGYFLRFFSMYRLSANIYAPLSYFGILMAYIYGIVINKDVITIKKIIGTILIMIPNIYLLKN